MPVTLHWDISITATSSIAHGGNTLGVQTHLRREEVVQPDGAAVEVPILSGNGFRARLRRTGERLLRELLDYDQVISRPAAHALRGGGSLAKTAAGALPATKLRSLRRLNPQVAVFGFAGSGRINQGCLAVGKIVPHVLETRHILPAHVGHAALRSAFEATQLETYTRQDDSADPDFVPIDMATELAAEAGHLMLFRVETLPAGTTFSSWIRLSHATPAVASFFSDVLNAYCTHSLIGGRTGIGHGRAHVEAMPRVISGHLEDFDWRADLLQHRDEAIEALTWIT